MGRPPPGGQRALNPPARPHKNPAKSADGFGKKGCRSGKAMLEFVNAFSASKKTFKNKAICRWAAIGREGPHAAHQHSREVKYSRPVPIT